MQTINILIIIATHSNIFNITIASIRVFTKPRQELWQQWWLSLDLWEGLSMALWSDASKDRLDKNVLSAHKIQVNKNQTEFDWNCCNTSTRWTGSSSALASPASPALVSSSAFVSPTSSASSSSSPFSSASSASPPTRSSSSWLSRTPTPWTRSYQRWRSNVSKITILFKVTMHLPGQIYSFVVILLGNSLYWQVFFQTNWQQRFLLRCSYHFYFYFFSRWKRVESTLARTKSLHCTMIPLSTRMLR